MELKEILSALTLVGLAATSSPATAGNYTVNCGTNGDSSLVQNQLAAISGTYNTLTVTGTCVGDLDITQINTLTITGLSLTGTISVYNATQIALQGLTLYGQLIVTDRSSITAANSTMNGGITLARFSSGNFDKLTVTQWTDPTTGAGGGGILCLQSSDCRFSNTTVTGLPSSDRSSPSTGINVGSTSRFNFGSGRISGFDWGVHVWNNSMAFFNPGCANLSIDSNRSIGVYVRDGGTVKLEGATPPLTSDCPAAVVIANNGDYGLLAEGGGLGFLYRAKVSGHVVDSLKVQNGSVVKVRSSSIAAATTSGRSARLKSNAHLWFDEEYYGPSAGSTFAGPVCLTNGSTVDTDNSSTTLTTVSSCP